MKESKCAVVINFKCFASCDNSYEGMKTCAYFKDDPELVICSNFIGDTGYCASSAAREKAVDKFIDDFKKYGRKILS